MSRARGGSGGIGPRVAGCAAGAGAGADGVDGAAGAAAGVVGVGFGPTAFTAAWQPGDSWATFCLRQRSASAPPRGTPAQWAMKSDRQEARIALICSSVGCWASAGPASIAIASAAID